MKDELKDRLENLKGMYTFRFDREEDCEYLCEKYGGEERMKEEYPTIYQSFLRARETVVRHAGEEAAPEQQWQEIKLRIEELPQKSNGVDKPDTLCVMSATLDCDFIDTTQEVQSENPAKPWIGITYLMTVKDVYSREVVWQTSAIIPQANSIHCLMESEPMFYKDIQDRAYILEFELQGKNSAGELYMNKYRSQEEVVGRLYTVANISIDHPAPHTTPHIVSNEIMMLYGRMNQQEIFKDADYKGGDYEKNAFDSTQNKVHLLLPFAGSVIMSPGAKAVGLHNPQEGEALTRMQATYDYKGQEFKYWKGAATDKELYERLKECFKYDAKDNKLLFDVRLEDKNDANRSWLDWHQDVSGVANGDPKTIMFRGMFAFDAINQLDIQTTELISVKSVTEDDLRRLKRQYYTYVEGSNTLYIPPITVYWGCFGRDVSIRLASGEEKCASDIQVKEILCGENGKWLTVSDILTGTDATIMQILTKKGNEIKVTGGHHMRTGKERIRASRIKKGDLLDLADGTVDEVVSVREIDYHDTVYNFLFEGEDSGNFVIANGFYSGDLRMQNEKDEIQEYELTDDDQQFIAEITRKNNQTEH